MKPLVSLSLFIACVVTVHGQQSGVLFLNRIVSTPTLLAPVYGVNPLDPLTRLSGNAITNGGIVDYTGHPLVFGTSYTASLWAAPVGQGVLPPLFQQLATAPFRTTASLHGYWASPPDGLATIIPFVTQPGTQAQLQVRVWNNMNGTVTTWAEALANSDVVALGNSDTFVLTPTFLPQTPNDLTGLTSFSLTIVPEPSTLAFGLVGTLIVGTWRLRRRR